MAHTEKEDIRILRTKQLLHDAFVSLLQQYPFYKITVNAMAAKAGINRVTFYLHYKNMEDFIERFIYQYISGFFFALSQHDDVTLPMDEREKRMLEHFLCYIQDNKTVYKLLFVQKALPQFEQQLIQSMKTPTVLHIHESIIKQYSVSDYEMPTEVASWYASSAMIGTITLWLEQDLPYSPRYLADKIVRLNPLRNLIP